MYFNLLIYIYYCRLIYVKLRINYTHISILQVLFYEVIDKIMHLLYFDMHLSKPIWVIYVFASLQYLSVNNE